MNTGSGQTEAAAASPAGGCCEDRPFPCPYQYPRPYPAVPKLLGRAQWLVGWGNQSFGMGLVIAAAVGYAGYRGLGRCCCYYWWDCRLLRGDGGGVLYVPARVCFDSGSGFYFDFDFGDMVVPVAVGGMENCWNRCRKWSLNHRGHLGT